MRDVFLLLVVVAVLLSPFAPAQGPTAQGDYATTCPGQAISIDVLANDQAANGLVCSALLLTVGPQHGSAVFAVEAGHGLPLCPQTTLRYTPVASFTGVDTLEYRVVDTLGNTADAEVTVEIGQPVVTQVPGHRLREERHASSFGLPLGSQYSGWHSTGVPNAPRLVLPRCVPRVGETLVGVEVTLSMRARSILRFENRDPASGCTLHLPQVFSFDVCPVATQPGACSMTGGCWQGAVTVTHTSPLGAFDGVIDFQGASGTVVGIRFAEGAEQESFSQPSALAAWLDTNPLDGISEQLEFDHSASEQASSSTGCAPCTFQMDPFAGLELSVVYTLSVPGEPFCAGDGSGTPCPCGNASPVGAALGCVHSGGAGAELRSEGAPSLAADSLVLIARNLTGSSALFLQGTALENGGAGVPLGDGLACVGGTLLRLGNASVVGGTASFPGPGHASMSTLGQLVQAGMRTYQVHYRNAAAYCTPSTANLSNGLRVDWIP